MALVATLETDLVVNASQFNASMDKSLGSINGFIKSFAGIAGAAIVFETLKHTVEGVFGVINETSERIETLANTSLRLGVGVPELQRLQYAGLQAGISTESMTKSLGFLEKNIAKAADGNTSLAGTFSQLGLNAKQLLSLPLDQQYLAIAGGFNRIQDPAHRSLAAIQLFGRGGLSQLQLMQRNVAQLTGEFTKLGGEITGKQASAVREYAEDVKKLGAIWEGFKTQLTVAVAGPFKQLIDSIITSVEKMGGLGAVAKEVAGFLINFAQVGTSVFVALITNVDAIIIKVEQLIKLLLQVAQYGTLGLANVISGTSGKIEALNSDIAARQARQSAVGSAGSTINNQLSSLSGQVQKVQIGVDINASPELTAKIVNSAELQRMTEITIRNLMSNAARGQGTR